MASTAQAGLDVESMLAESNRTEQESAAASTSASSVAMNVRMVHGMMGEMMRGISQVDTRVTESQRIERAGAEAAKASEHVSALTRAMNEIAATAKPHKRLRFPIMICYGLRCIGYASGSIKTRWR